MTHEEIRKLLGGYATNTLTESERRALMEAALDDQELFNALQDEEALRQLLADPASREQVHQALEEKPAPARRSRGWVWGGVLGAAAVAAVAIAVVVERTPPQPAPPPVQIATSQAPVKTVAPEAPQPVARELKAKVAVASEPAPVPAGVPAPAAQGVLGGVPAQQARDQSIGALTSARELKKAAVAAYIGAPLHYTVLRRNPDGAFLPLPAGENLRAGDAVRLSITPAAPGSLTVYRLSKSGEAATVSPAMAVEAGMTYSVPASAVELTGSDQRLRMVLETNATAPVTADVPIGSN